MAIQNTLPSWYTSACDMSLVELTLLFEEQRKLPDSQREIYPWMEEVIISEIARNRFGQQSSGFDAWRTRSGVLEDAPFPMDIQESAPFAVTQEEPPRLLLPFGEGSSTDLPSSFPLMRNMKKLSSVSEPQSFFSVMMPIPQVAVSVLGLDAQAEIVAQSSSSLYSCQKNQFQQVQTAAREIFACRKRKELESRLKPRTNPVRGRSSPLREVECVDEEPSGYKRVFSAPK